MARRRPGLRGRLVVLLLAWLAPALALAAPNFSASPTAVDFGSVLVGQSKTLSVTITNISGTTLTPNWVGGGSGIFGGVQNCVGHTFAPGDTCTVNYTFTPSAPGVQTDSTSIFIQVTGQPRETLSLTFTGAGVLPGSGVSSVPTLGEWSMALLALLAGGLAMRRLGRGGVGAPGRL